MVCVMFTECQASAHCGAASASQWLTHSLAFFFFFFFILLFFDSVCAVCVELSRLGARTICLLFINNISYGVLLLFLFAGRSVEEQQIVEFK